MKKEMIRFGHIYAIQFSDGSVKVGRTRNLTQRMSQHSSFASKAGLWIVEQASSVFMPNYETAEREIIALCRSLSSRERSSENFEGVDFNALKEFINSFTLLTDEAFTSIQSLNNEIKKEASIKLDAGVNKMNAIHNGVNPESETYIFDSLVVPSLNKMECIKRSLGQLFDVHVAAHNAYEIPLDERVVMLADCMRYLQAASDMLSLSMEGMTVDACYNDSGKNLNSFMVNRLGNESESMLAEAIQYLSSVKKSDTGFVFPPMDCWKNVKSENDDSEAEK